HAHISYVDVTGTPFHPLDFQYNIGMLSCVPCLFGLPLARVSHPVCAGDGGDACVYQVSWEPGGSYMRFALGSILAGAAALATTGVFDPALVPAAGVLAGVLGLVAGRRVLGVRRRRWRQLESEVQWQGEVAQRLAGSLQDIVSELRLEDVLEKVTSNARSTLEGRGFALLVDEADGPVLLEDLALVPSLAMLEHGSLCTAPLTYRGESLGVLVALSATPFSFMPRDVDVVQSFATQAAIALSNARLYEAQQELASR